MEDLLKKLKEYNISISLDNTDLKVRYNDATLPQDLIREIKDNKSLIVEYLANLHRHTSNEDIKPLAPGKHFPLSSSQLRLWTLSQLDEDFSAYNMGGIYEFEGDLNLQALEYSFEMLIRRHEILRTVFGEDDRGQACQAVRSPEEAGLKIVYEDLRQEKVPEQKLKDLIRSAFIRPFDLVSGPVLRVNLYAIADNKWIFSHVMHHIVSDGWSNNILIRELLTLYNAYARGEANPLIPLSIQYKDYAAWQYSRVKNGSMDGHRTYWLNQFKGELPVLRLPGDKARPVVKNYAGATTSKAINPELSSSLKSLCQDQGCTLFMGLLAIVNILLYRYTCQRDIIIGTPVAGRDHKDLEDQIGFYINTLAIRTRFMGENSFMELLANIRELTLNAYEHQEYPFDELVNGLGAKRDLSRDVLFDVMVLLLNTNLFDAGQVAHSLDGVTVRKYDAGDPPVSKYDLIFYFAEADGHVLNTMEYNSDIFNAGTIERLGNHFENLWELVVDNPLMTIDELVVRSIRGQSPPVNIRNAALEIAGCSEHQKRLWFIDQFEKNYLYDKSPVYHNLPLVVKIPRTIDIRALTNSVNAVVTANPVLRTRILNENSIPVQWISEDPGKAIQIHELEDQLSEVNKKIIEIIHRPFDIENDPLIRFDLICYDRAPRYFIFTAHHLIADRATLRILEKDIFTRYQTGITGSSSAYDGAVQYANYAEWQNGLTVNDWDGASFYWKKKLENAPVLYLETDKPREHIHIYEADLVTRPLSPGLSEQIERFCGEYDISPELFLLSVFNALLYRYTGSEEIVIGTFFDNRQQKEWQHVIGPVGNLITLKNRMDGRGDFWTLLEQVSSDYKNSVRFSGIPFEKVVLEINPGKDMSRTALFDVLIRYERLPAETIQQENGPDGGPGVVELNLGMGKYDFNLLIRHGKTIELYLTYNKRYFDLARIQRFLEYYNTFTEEILNAPGKAIDEIDYISSREKQRLAMEFNDSQAGYPKEMTIVHLWEQQVEKTPDNTAVVSGDTTFSYRQLNERSNRLAYYLRSHYAIQPDDLVGIKLQRSEWLIVCILGILKSGAAYVPIDPDYPRERIDYMISDSSCKVLVDTREIRQFRAEEENYPADNPPLVNSPADLAYVIYTSGTTGNPKGAMIEHRNVVRLFHTDKPLFDFRDTDTWTLFHSFCFDFSVWEMFGALLFGGKLIIIPSLVAKDPSAFLEILDKEGVTVLNQTPSAFYQLVKEDLRKEKAALSLRYIIFGGEALSPGKLAEWREKYPYTRLINMYGITETTVHVTYKEITEEEIERGASNIGRPIPTLRCYILDKNKKPVPIGVPGELYVGGEGVCRGYLNREDLTNHRFITSTLDCSGRLYRSGDKVKVGENGEMEYMGRIDQQVKVRGYRIELGEIENALQKDGNIEEAVVIARPDAGGEIELVAYVVSRRRLISRDIRSDLAMQLPAYMLPAHFVQLDRMPLTSNGKVDKKALPEPEDLDLSTGIEYTAPRNDIEEGLASIWQDVLGIGQAGITDNFFDLGGHSLKATRLAGQIHKVFDVKITLKELFANPVLEDQARLLQQAVKTAFNTIPPVAIQADYPLSSSQRRLWVLSQLEKNNAAYNMPGVCTIEGDLDPHALEYSFITLFRRHESLRTVFRTNEQGDIRQVILPPEDTGFCIRHQDMRDAEGQCEKIRQSVNAVFSQPFDLSAGPLIQAVLIRIAERNYVFTYVMHHIISDGWSMGIFINEISFLYGSFIEGKGNPLVPLRIQYKDYAAWQQRQLIGGGLEAQKKYWISRFSGELPLLELPIAKTRPGIKTYNGLSIVRRLNAGLGNGIKTLCQEEGSTLFMGLLSAVNILLYRYTGQNDIIIGSPIAGREHADLEDQIGFYINTIALRTQFSGDDHYRQLLRNVREVSMSAYEHQAYPFDDLVNVLNLRRDMSRSPLFDVMVILQNTEIAATRNYPGTDKIIIDGYEEEASQVSKFDVTFTFTEAGEEIMARIEYNTDIYEGDRIEKMVDHFESLLQAIINNPSTPISRLDYLSAPEKAQLLSAFNDTRTGLLYSKSVIELFEAWVERTPDKVALIFEGEELTYQTANEYANQFGEYLRERYSILPDDLVGIKLERSQWLIIAILGVLKSGGAYLPIDLDYPQFRVDYLIEDSGCKVLVDEEELEKFKAVRRNYNKANSGLTGKGTDTAYVIYTSGSTGFPKGCAIANNSLSNYIQWANDYYFRGAARANFGLFTSISFDLTVTSIFCCLTNGSRLHIYSQHEDLPQILNHSFGRDSGHDSIKLTPSHISLLKQLDITNSEMACAIVGGEEVTQEQVFVLKKINPAIRIYNEYGPTEATVGCIVKELETNKPISIGKPIANTYVCILDERHQLCPIGVSGEIYIAGVCLGKGYLNRPELTSGKFVADPFRPGERMYRTGDLGRWQPDGNITFVGRKDDQVKIRGYRIELSEIENALRSHPHIGSVAVLPQPDGDGGKELVAYLTGEYTLKSSDIRAHLEKIMPAYMFPAHYIQLTELPLTRNGKVDKGSLPAPGSQVMSTGAEYMPARNDVEERLIAIWEEILERQKVGIKDNFFDLGGNSIRLIKMVGIVNKVFTLNISVVTAFRFPSIEKLSACMDNENQTADGESEEAMQADVTVMEETFNSLNYITDENGV